jgi:hypothetical protein
MRETAFRFATAAVLLITVFQPFACSQVPEFFGIYAVVDGKTASLIGGKGSFKPAETSLPLYDFQSLSTQDQKVLILAGGDLRFQVFDAAVADASANLTVYKIPFGRNLITRPDSLQQAYGMLNQASGRPGPQPKVSPLQKYVLARIDTQKISLLQKPVSGQPQMVQLVPETDFEPGLYAAFAVRSKDGEKTIVWQLFEWKGSAGSTEKQFCIDLAITGGFGGMMERSDAQMTDPHDLGSGQYSTCAASDATGSGTAPAASAANPAPPPVSVKATCADFDGCVKEGNTAFSSDAWPAALADFQAAAKFRPAAGETWVKVGIAGLAVGRYEELAPAWDSALKLGQTIAVGVCEKQGLHPCQDTVLSLSPAEVSLAAVGGQKLFSVSPAEVKVKNAGSNGVVAMLTFEVSGKKFELQYIPRNVLCTKPSLLTCPGGVDQEAAVSKYIADTVPKLASGAFGAH